MSSIFSDRLVHKIREKKNALVVGLDPHPQWIPPNTTMKNFCFGVIEALYDLIPVIKIQIAFFEGLGSEGFRLLEEIVPFCHDKGLLVIADAKRGDIPSTLKAYASYYFDRLQVDSLTVSPYFGPDILDVFSPYLQHQGKGLWLLIQTTGQNAALLQDILVCSPMQEKVPYSEYVAEQMYLAFTHHGTQHYSPIGFVVGLRNQVIVRRLRKKFPFTFFLVPGVGVQGGRVVDTSLCFQEDGFGALISVSRQIVFAYLSPKWHRERERWDDAARWQTEVLVQSLSCIQKIS